MSDTQVQQDYNGLWFVTNSEGFPVSQAYATEMEAQVFNKLLKETKD